MPHLMPYPLCLLVYDEFRVMCLARIDKLIGRFENTVSLTYSNAWSESFGTVRFSRTWWYSQNNISDEFYR
jgi:hypothetical protein